MSAYQKRVVETKVRKFHSLINQAVKLAVVDYGDVDGWVHDSSIFSTAIQTRMNASYAENKKFLEKYFIPYMKRAEIYSAKYENYVAVKLLDGSVFSYNFQAVDSTGIVSIIKYYVNGKVEDTSSRNMFAFIFDSQNSVKPYDLLWDGKNTDVLYNEPVWGCAKGMRIGMKNGLYCTKILQLNNWKIPKDYPW